MNLIFDADDTLWENNIYFEAAFDEFVEFLAHSSMTPPQVRFVLDEIERVNSRIHGYGSLNFGRNLGQCYRKLAEREIREEDLETVMAFAERILDRPIELIEGVPETLEELGRRHSLTIFTKGHPDEQRIKVERSGLERYFGHTAIVKEKNVEAYEALVARLGVDKDDTWMIGNSPKSDVNPSLAAGLGAVFVPHARTWVLEHETVPDRHDRLLVVERFTELTRHF